jgi:lipopolysaccharide export system permease protein
LFKRLHSLLIASFVPPFIATFLVTWFVFIVQFFWLYIDDLVGKGLDTSIILQLIAYLAPTIVPAALPLGILLAGIMTFGNLAESSELTAVRSAGISLWRFATPLIIFVVGITLAAFAFNNYVIPVANLKFWTLLMDVRNTKPAVNLKAGAFYSDIPGFSIYIDKKDANNRTVYNCMIYDHTSGKGNDKVILAKQAEMYVSDDKRYLIFELKNGCRYEEKQGKTPKDHEQVRLQFKYWKKIFDLSSFEMRKSDENYLKGNEIMLSNSALSKRIDSTQKRINGFALTSFESMKPNAAMLKLDSTNKDILPQVPNTKIPNKFLELFPDSLRTQILTNAESNLRSMHGSTSIYRSDDDIQQTVIARYKIEWHKKLSLAASCLILFLIGAPLGALIRKGGFGLPFVTAVLFFVLYRFMTVFSEKLAVESTVSPLVGMWLPPLILLCIAVLLLYQANRDKKVLDISTILARFKTITSKLRRR